MALTREDLLEARARAEDDYRRDLAAIDRMLERFCAANPDEAVVSKPGSTSPPDLPVVRRSTPFQAGLEQRVRDVVTAGGHPSPWSAKGVYSMLGSSFPFAQKEEGAINSILIILKGLADKGLMHEQKGSGRRPSFFTWDINQYPGGVSNRHGLEELALTEPIREDKDETPTN